MLDILANLGPLGFTDVDGVAVLPDGRIAVSSATTFTPAIPGLSKVWSQNVYIFDPATGSLVLSFDLGSLGFKDNEGFALIREETGASPF